MMPTSYLHMRPLLRLFPRGVLRTLHAGEIAQEEGA